MTEGYFTSGREMPEEQNALPERARVITPDMLVQLPARGYEIKNRRLTFEKDMSALPFFILLIITVNVIFFLMELSTGALQSEQALLAAGALKRELVLGGQYWRMISCAFLHGSTGHLVGNMIFLYILGMATEHAFGLPRTAAVYFVAAVSGSLLSIFAHQGPSVGASGAIFGLMGALVMYFWKNRDIFNLRDGNIGLFIAAIAIIQIIMGLSDPYIDINAHIGGFIGGGIIAFFLKSRLTGGEALKQTLGTAQKFAVVMIVLLVSLFGMLAKGHIFLIIAGADAPFVTPATAISYADQALRLNPGNDYAYVVRSRALLQHGNPDQAIADLKTFVARHPDRTEGLELLGHIYFSREEYTAAIRYYTAAIRIQPSPDSLNSRGYCEILTHQDKIARDDFLRILTMDDKYAPAYGNLGLLDAIDGSYDSAIINMQKSYDLDHSLRVVKLLVAALKAEKSGSKFEAIAYYEQFIGRTGGAHEWRAERRFAAERAALLRQE